MLGALPCSYQVTPNIPTGDKRQTKGKSGQPGPTASKRESARRPVGTFSSASDVTDHRIETASLNATAPYALVAPLVALSDSSEAVLLRAVGAAARHPNPGQVMMSRRSPGSPPPSRLAPGGCPILSRKRRINGTETLVIIPLAASSTGFVLLGAIYVVLLVTLGIMSIRKGHWVMFIIGIFIPLFWIIGALMPPKRG